MFGNGFSEKCVPWKFGRIQYASPKNMCEIQFDELLHNTVMFNQWSYFFVSLIQVYVLEKRLFTLEFIDESFKKLNLRIFDGDKPSPLNGISLTSVDSNLRQHGKYLKITHACMWVKINVVWYNV